MVILVTAESPYKTLAQLIDAARKEPGKLNYGTSGTGGLHDTIEMLQAAAHSQNAACALQGVEPGPRRLP